MAHEKPLKLKDRRSGNYVWLNIRSGVVVGAMGSDPDRFMGLTVEGAKRLASGRKGGMTADQIERYRSGRKWGWPADLAFKSATGRALSRTPGRR